LEEETSLRSSPEITYQRRRRGNSRESGKIEDRGTYTPEETEQRMGT